MQTGGRSGASEGARWAYGARGLDVGVQGDGAIADLENPLYFSRENAFAALA